MPEPFPSLTFTSQDIFSSSNQFNGGEIGLKGQSQHGRLGFEFVTKVAFGNNRQKTYINGWNTFDSGGVVTENVGGLLAQPTNIGTHQRDVFAILPEADVTLKWDITCNLRATLGYMFVYINRVQRSGDAIDLNVNPDADQWWHPRRRCPTGLFLDRHNLVGPRCDGGCRVPLVITILICRHAWSWVGDNDMRWSLPRTERGSDQRIFRWLLGDLAAEV